MIAVVLVPALALPTWVHKARQLLPAKPNNQHKKRGAIGRRHPKSKIPTAKCRRPKSRRPKVGNVDRFGILILLWLYLEHVVRGSWPWRALVSSRSTNRPYFGPEYTSVCREAFCRRSPRPPDSCRSLSRSSAPVLCGFIRVNQQNIMYACTVRRSCQRERISGLTFINKSQT